MNDYVNKQLGDLIILEKISSNVNGSGQKITCSSNRYYYKVKCTKCGRVTVRRCSSIHEHKGLYHSNCSNYIDKIEPYYRYFHGKFLAMRGRCTNPKNPGYKNYGARGIKCSYEYVVDFYDDMWESYIGHCKKYGPENTTLDRIDPNGNYEKSNLKWATKEEQNRNTTRHREFIAISPDGVVTQHLYQNEFARQMGWNAGRVNELLKGVKKSYKGWKLEYVK